jgi:hypothetical protein
MHENPEAYVSSAKQLMELNQKREKEALRKEAAANKATQLASEQIALLKESNELARKALAEANLRSEQERALHKSNSTDVVDIKPNFFGLGANLNEAWRRYKKWRSK